MSQSVQSAIKKVGQGQMLRLFKVLFFLGVIGAIGLTAFAFLGDLQPNRVEVNEPVELDAN